MWTFLLNLLVLLLSATLIGFERQKAHGVIGVRSVSLIMLGAFVFAYFSGKIGGDPARVVAQVVSGVGFIGAGLIFKQDIDKIANVTTAILIWCLAALGCLIGLGFLVEGVVITIIIFLILKFYKKLFKDGN